MIYESYAHRFADIILNSDYSLKREIEQIIQSIDFNDVQKRFDKENQQRKSTGKKPAKGKQSTINLIFREAFINKGWENEKNVFDDPKNDLAIDFWKRNVGVDIAFSHRSFIGGDLLRFQAAAEVKNVINVGVYICATKSFAKLVSPSDASSMVSYERTKWYLETLYPVLTVPILLVGLDG